MNTSINKPSNTLLIKSKEPNLAGYISISLKWHKGIKQPIICKSCFL